jgi:S-adenosylmethionine:tRNA ribosyltransferase-isomerase
LVLDRTKGAIADRRFADLPSLLRPGDLVVLNDTRVFPARLLGRRLPGGGAAECLLVCRLERLARRPPTPPATALSPAEDRATVGSAADRMPATADVEIWEALVHPGQRLKPGSRVEFGAGATVLHGEILDRRFHGRRAVKLWTESGSIDDVIDTIGHVPLPPYIKRPDTASDRERYQTIYARKRGSIAAPTAGLHFTPDVLEALDAGGIERTTITLHVGYGTFQPIRVEQLQHHRMAAEQFEVSRAAAAAISGALAERRRVIAVGTTTTRTLESLQVGPGGRVEPSAGTTDLFIRPGHPFKVVSGLVTNFHLPQSSLLVLVSAFAGREHVLAAYRHAVEQRYRFYSYGDASLIL